MTPSPSPPDGEEAFLRRMIERTGGARHSLLGDDAAVLESFSPPLLYTVDGLQHDVHYDDTLPPRRVGQKLVGVNLSDIAAMGGRPRWALLSLASNRDASVLEEWIEGVVKALKQAGARLAGGDLSSLSEAGAENATLALLGRASPEGLLRRSDARPGDLVAISGPLGGAAAARRVDPDRRSLREQRLLYDLPDTLETGRRLVSIGVRGGLDVSDGLVKDLRRLCEASGVGARLELDRLPRHPVLEAHDLPEETVLRLILGGGEDFELLVAVPPEREDDLPAGMTVVGRFTETSGVRFVPELPFARDTLVEGYDHFANPDTRAP